MNDLDQALKEVRALHSQFFGRSAPAAETQPFAPMPPGVDPVEYALNEVESLKQLAGRFTHATQPAPWAPLADSFLVKNELVLQLEVPGVSSEDLKVFAKGGECIVRGERKPPKHLPSMRPLALERPWGPFERRFVLPVGTQTSKIKARARAGLLELRIPLEKDAVAEEHEVEVE